MKRKILLTPIFVLVVLFLLLSVNAFAWKKPYQKGLDYMKSHAFEQAMEQFNEALSSPDIKEKNAEKVKEKLDEARQLAAQDFFERGQRFSNQHNMKDALTAFEKAKDLQPQNVQYLQAYEQEEKKYDDIDSKINQGFQDGIEKGEWDQAIEALKSYTLYESSFPQISQRIEELKNKAADFYQNRSDDHLARKQYQGAYEEINKASLYSPSEMIKNKKLARHHLLMSSESWEQKQYLRSYEEIQKGLTFGPDHPELLAFQKKILDEWLGILYNEAVKANNDGQYAAAQERLKRISHISPGYLNTEELLSEIQSAVASQAYETAEAIMTSQDRSKIGTALANYFLVREQHSALYPDIDQKIDEAKRLLKKELEFRISVDFENKSSEPQAAEMVQDLLLSKIKGSAELKHITILDRESINDILREQGLGQGFLDESTALETKKIKGIQAGIKGEVIKLQVKESGRERPSYGSSKYVSGKRFVPNPAYQQAQADVTSSQQRTLQAQTDLNQSQMQQNQMLNQQNTADPSVNLFMSGLAQMGGVFGQTALQTAKNDLADAQSRLASTPMQIEENIESDYRYEIFDLQLTAEAVISLKVINYTTSEIGQVHAIKKLESVSDRYIPGDPGKGVASDPNQLPTVEEYKSRVLQSAIQETFDAMVKELSTINDGYYQAAQKAEKNDLAPDALEQYMRYIYSASDLKDKRVQHANDYIYDKMGIYVIRRKP